MSLNTDNIMLSCTDEIISMYKTLKTLHKILELINEFSKVAGYKIYSDLLHFFTLEMKYQRK